MTYEEGKFGANIGDFIQSVAAKQYFSESDSPIFLKRDHLNEYDGEKVKLIMNGWFTHIPENFPPSDKIEPLLVAFHINSSVKDTFLSEKMISYLKAHEPIGCRDQYTVQLLKERGVQAYFSGCLTLTLGKKYKNPLKTDETIFVDPYIGIDKSISGIFSAVKTLISKKRVVDELCRKIFKKKTIKKIIKTAFFINQYSKFWNEELLLNSTYITHQYFCDSDEEFLNEAEKLVKRYASAKLIVTSRIHCALPSTGLGTPVIYIQNTNENEISFCRLDGLIQLLNVIHHNGRRLINDNNIDVMNPPIRKDYIPLAKKLMERCEEFCS